MITVPPLGGGSGSDFESDEFWATLALTAPRQEHASELLHFQREQVVRVRNERRDRHVLIRHFEQGSNSCPKRRANDVTERVAGGNEAKVNVCVKAVQKVIHDRNPPHRCVVSELDTSAGSRRLGGLRLCQQKMTQNLERHKTPRCPLNPTAESRQHQLKKLTGSIRAVKGSPSPGLGAVLGRA